MAQQFATPCQGLNEQQLTLPHSAKPPYAGPRQRKGYQCASAAWPTLLMEQALGQASLQALFTGDERLSQGRLAFAADASLSGIQGVEP